MKVPRLRWPASTDPDIVKYRIYRWRGERPPRPAAIMEVTVNHRAIIIRTPVRMTAPSIYELPLTPVPNGTTDLLVDGISTPFEREGNIIRSLSPIESWRLVEAIFEVYGMEALDSNAVQTDVVYTGPLPVDYSLKAEFWNLELRHLTPDQVGHTEITWYDQIEFGGGTIYNYEVCAVSSSGVESGPSPVRAVVLSDVGNITALVERSEDGAIWTTSNTIFGNTYRTHGTTTKPDQVRNVQCNVSHDIATASATAVISWDFLRLERTVDSSIFRLTPMLGATKIGEISEQVGPIPLTIPVEGVLVRHRTDGEVPTATGPESVNVQASDATVKMAVLSNLQSNTTYKIGLFTKEPTGLYSDPVVIRIVLGTLGSTNPVITVTIE